MIPTVIAEAITGAGMWLLSRLIVSLFNRPDALFPDPSSISKNIGLEGFIVLPIIVVVALIVLPLLAIIVLAVLCVAIGVFLSLGFLVLELGINLFRDASTYRNPLDMLQQRCLAIATFLGGMIPTKRR